MHSIHDVDSQSDDTADRVRETVHFKLNGIVTHLDPAERRRSGPAVMHAVDSERRLTAA